MSAIELSAELIRRAIVDEGYEQDLQDAIDRRSAAVEELLRGPIDGRDLPYLRPSEWLWFAFWRQGHGGAFDLGLVNYLEVALPSRDKRYELRALVMRDPEAEGRVSEADGLADEIETSALLWLRRHAVEFPDPLEVARDALQIATEPAWFTLRALTSQGGRRGDVVRGQLNAFAEQREVDPEIRARWFPSGEPQQPFG